MCAKLPTLKIQLYVGHKIGAVRIGICSCIGPPRSPLRVAWCEILTRSNKGCAATAEAVTVAADRTAVSQEQMFLRGAVTCDQGSKGLDFIDFEQNHESKMRVGTRDIAIKSIPKK